MSESALLCSREGHDGEARLGAVSLHETFQDGRTILSGGTTVTRHTGRTAATPDQCDFRIAKQIFVSEITYLNEKRQVVWYGNI